MISKSSIYHLPIYPYHLVLTASLYKKKKELPSTNVLPLLDFWGELNRSGDSVVLRPNILIVPENKCTEAGG